MLPRTDLRPAPTTRSLAMKDRFRFKPRTHPLVWVTAIVCTILSIAVIITGIVVFVGYMIIRPRVPFISVTSAHLDTIRYDQAGLLEIQMAIDIRAENDNAKAHASFSDTSFVLSFDALQIAKLVAGPFDVSKNSSTVFNYVIPSSQIPLDRTRMEQLDFSLKRNEITFDLKGKSRTRWRVGLLGSVKFWCHLSCELRFHTSNGSYINSRRCSSKSK
ncbi:NDR1/HIN1-like protein 12 [Juglans microcarpa x Juglans regia]|uniref:NDR1/HIN1-like protein 12 n=1 Tax=Juglans microcarpa x Juglans regia TaxID=2249226 RepID=UPI001B7DBC37|nr:NDR1/HIN1-like protein 12 [Juglans microcarpa x Juglans regia]